MRDDLKADGMFLQSPLIQDALIRNFEVGKVQPKPPN